MKITEFDIQLEEDHILSMLDIMEGKEEEIRKRLRDILPEAYTHLHPVAIFAFEGEALYGLQTVGSEITDWANQLLEEGEYVKGLLADTIANAYLFAMDEALSDQVVALCKERGKGIATRLEAPKNVPIFMQKKILEVTDGTNQAGITINDSMMLHPIKTMGQVYLLNDDTETYQNCHTCEGCKAENCPSRKTGAVPSC